MSDKKHTPVPWHAGPRTGMGYYFIGRRAGGGSSFMELNPGSHIEGEDEANAGFIIKAVNSHDDLVRLLDICLCALDEATGTDAIYADDGSNRSVKKITARQFLEKVKS